MEMIVKTLVGDKTLSIQTGTLAKQASGAVVVQYGETIVLVTVVASPEERNVDFLPLTVEYQEKIYAAGRIPGNCRRHRPTAVRSSPLTRVARRPPAGREPADRGPPRTLACRLRASPAILCA